MSRNKSVKLSIPRQDLRDFKFFQLSKAAAAEWAGNLPVADARSVSQQLQEVFSHLNRVEINPELRYNVMEMLRPKLLVALSTLSKRFLNQSLVMPEGPRQIAALAEALYTLAGTGYTIVAIQAIQRRDSIRGKNPAQLVCESVHRAIHLVGAKLLRTFQLYRPVDLHGWLTLHQLYALAEGNKLAELPVTDSLLGDSSVANIYLQAILLGCCKPNQLRQSELAALYRGMQDWAHLLRIDPHDHKSLFLVDLDSDQPPMYSSLYKEPPGPRTRYIDTEPLVEHLKQLRPEDEQAGILFDKDTIVSPGLLEHMMHSLSSMSMRNFTRRESHKSIWISLGLSSTHFHLSKKRTFEQLLYGDDFIPPPAERLPDNPFIKPREKVDMWQEANPEEDFVEVQFTPEEKEVAHEIQVDPATLALLEEVDDSEPADSELYPIHQVALADISPGGYCFEWSSELPGDMKTGDIVGVQETQEGPWVIAVVRWMSHVEDTTSLIGLELLSTRAMPYGARMQLKRGEETTPMRVLLLPEITLVGQPHTVITPRAGFRERQKIILMRHGEEFYIQLLRQIAITGSFAQFDFRYIKQLGEVLAEDKSQPKDFSFDSLWTNI